MMPHALTKLGLPVHAYIILIGSLLAMLPTILDSLLVSILKYVN